MYPYFIALVIYLLVKEYICSTYILTFNLSHEVPRIFFLVQFLAFFLDLTPPLPGYLMVHPLDISVYMLKCVFCSHILL